MSDSARTAYMESRLAGGSVEESIQAAQSASEESHAVQLQEWESLNDYAQAHSAFGHEIDVFGDRSLISFTTRPDIAEDFANGGSIFTVDGPIQNAIEQTLPGAGESEWLIMHLIKASHLGE